MKMPFFMKALIVLVMLGANTSFANEKCKILKGIYVGQKLAPGRYHIKHELDYRTGLSGVGNAILVLSKGDFKSSGKFNSVIFYKREGTGVLNVDGFDHKVPIFRECK